jgi:hypothetical protein
MALVRSFRYYSRNFVVLLIVDTAVPMESQIQEVCKEKCTSSKKVFGFLASKVTVLKQVS